MKKILLAWTVLWGMTLLSYGAHITIYHPNGNEKLILTKTYTIDWTFCGTPDNVSTTVRIELYKGGLKAFNLVGIIAQNVPIGPLHDAPTTSGSYNWTVGAYKGGSALPGPGYFIRVTSMQNSFNSDYCDGPFTLAVKGLLDKGGVNIRP